MTKPTLFLVPIEPIESRYTASWYRNFPPALSTDFDVRVIDGVPLTDKIEVGSFLDINSTVAYKSSQMQAIAKLFREGNVPNGSVFFVLDIEFWGIEAIRLMAQMNGVNVTLVGFLHAGSYYTDDAFAVAAPYQQYTEVGWVAAFDLVMVGSQYHKDMFVEKRLVPAGRSDLAARISVCPNPLFEQDYARTGKPKVNQVVLPNRVDWGKRPDLAFTIAALVKAKRPDWKFVVTTGKDDLHSDRKWLSDYAYWLESQGVLEIKRGLSKAQYHEVLETSKIMLTTSIDETFGYCIAESMHYGTLPLMRQGLSHTEFQCPSEFYFKDEDDAIEKLVDMMDNTDYYGNCMADDMEATDFEGKYLRGVDAMVREIRNVAKRKKVVV